jgi:hypothetical protein
MRLPEGCRASAFLVKEKGLPRRKGASPATCFVEVEISVSQNADDAGAGAFRGACRRVALFRAARGRDVARTVTVTRGRGFRARGSSPGLFRRG